ncbi:hypothetical protein DB32_008819 [Sandaracinus amylolyticus]|uniref:Uncharacterized protein n=1 Tax=Sandaracinus amylolyticus TaxID=927083 RepID=A0A0F6YNA5_9BACT|nr:hypothetical protein DB32_008819 [Sandaracinus amylolyticus]
MRPRALPQRRPSRRAREHAPLHRSLSPRRLRRPSRRRRRAAQDRDDYGDRFTRCAFDARVECFLEGWSVRAILECSVEGGERLPITYRRGDL